MRLLSTEAPSLHRHYPASLVLRASRHPIRPSLTLAGCRLIVSYDHRIGLPVLRPVYLCLHAVTTAPAVTVESVRSYSSTGISLPRKSGGSAPALVVSGPARCLLRITACRLAKSPKATLYIRGSGNFVTSVAAPIASGWSEPVPGRDLQPAVDQRLSRRTDYCLPIHRIHADAKTTELFRNRPE